MDLTAQVDDYCERLGPGLWAEPVNALTNLAFIAVALWLWPRTRGIERWLCAVLLVIGIGSGLFHTFATRWAGLADTIPIALFILTYVFAATRRFFGARSRVAGAAVVLFLPYLALAGGAFARLPGFAVSAMYWPVPLAILAYALALVRTRPRAARGLAIGAILLVVSLVARSLDMALCAAVPLGTHWLWHLLNAAMLGWMIGVLRRERLERRGAGR